MFMKKMRFSRGHLNKIKKKTIMFVSLFLNLRNSNLVCYAFSAKPIIIIYCIII